MALNTLLLFNSPPINEELIKELLCLQHGSGQLVTPELGAQAGGDGFSQSSAFPDVGSIGKLLQNGSDSSGWGLSESADLNIHAGQYLTQCCGCSGITVRCHFVFFQSRVDLSASTL